MAIDSITEIIANQEAVNPEQLCRFNTNCSNLIRKLEESSDVNHWAKLIRIQHTDLKTLLEVTEVSPNQDLTPPNTAQPTTFHKFSPLLDDSSKLSCTVVSCKSKFACKETYRIHMKTQHPNEQIDYSKEDPLGEFLILFQSRSRL